MFTPLKKFKFIKHSELYFPCDWDNCSGEHLNVQLPTGNWWDIDSRGANCSAPWDKNHRCWVKQGDLPFITINKDGYTCDAGGGSVLTRNPNWHGFLRNGNFYEESFPPGAGI